MYFAHMRKKDKAGREIFYSLHLCEDLISGWSIIREWGMVGNEGRVYSSLAPSEPSASDCIESIIASNVRRGYSLVSSR